MDIENIKIEDQEKVWSRIAPEWFEYKEKTNPDNIDFVKNAKGKLLDVGCATGRHFIKTKAEIYASDFSTEMIEYAKKKAKEKGISNIKFFVASAEDLPFEDEFFENTICIAVIHCIQGKDHRMNALKEIFRTLKKKGKLKISVWNKQSGRFLKKNKEDTVKWTDKGERYYYFYDEEEFLSELKEAGFRILKKQIGVNIDVLAEK